MSLTIPLVTADTTNTSQAGNMTNELDTIITTNSSLQDTNVNSTHDNSTEESDNTSISTMKEPRTDLMYATVPDTNELGAINESAPEETGENVTPRTVENSTESAIEYDSLGDIIKAQDWKALSEYKCRIKTENPNSFDDSDISMSDKEARWNSYFNPPQPVVSSPCCG